MLLISFQNSGSGGSSTWVVLTVWVAGFQPKRPGFRGSKVRQEFALTDGHIFTHTDTHADTHRHTHTQMQTHKHMYTHPQTHTHTWGVPL